ncbi:conserved hypothetical protein, partial [Ricinus communis]
RCFSSANEENNHAREYCPGSRGRPQFLLRLARPDRRHPAGSTVVDLPLARQHPARRHQNHARRSGFLPAGAGGVHASPGQSARGRRGGPEIQTVLHRTGAFRDRADGQHPEGRSGHLGGAGHGHREDFRSAGQTRDAGTVQARRRLAAIPAPRGKLVRQRDAADVRRLQAQAAADLFPAVAAAGDLPEHRQHPPVPHAVAASGAGRAHQRRTGRTGPGHGRRADGAADRLGKVPARAGIGVPAAGFRLAGDCLHDAVRRAILVRHAAARGADARHRRQTGRVCRAAAGAGGLAARRPVRVHEHARNRDVRHALRPFVVRPEPARLGQLVGVDADLAARIISGERDHQRVRERPGLAAEVAQLAHLQAHFLVHLAVYRLLDRFARLQETGQRGETPGWRIHMHRHQVGIVFTDQHHHRWRNAR